MTTTTCSIKLFNKCYEIKCPQGEEDKLQLAAKKLQDHLLQVKRKHKQLDEHQCLVLASITLSHELISCQTEQEQQKKQMTQFINSLETKINKMVGGEVVA